MMNYMLTSLALLLSSFLVANAQSTENLQDFTGTYVIDLRPSPDSDEYLQLFTVSEVSGNTFSGTFYGSKITDGLINSKFENTYLAFTTEDRSNRYYHFVKILNQAIEGLTYSKDRKLIQPWTGTKKE